MYVVGDVYLSPSFFKYTYLSLILEWYMYMYLVVDLYLSQ